MAQRGSCFLMCIVIVLLDVHVHAWNRAGHEAAALVAQRRLSPAAAAAVAAILDGQSMAAVSMWADDVKTTPRWRKTFDWHFVNIPLNATGYDRGRDCRSHGEGVCIIDALRDLEHTLTTSRQPEARREALMFFIHLVADLHEPLHAAGDYDGGTVFPIAVVNGATNLHTAWDGALFHTGRSDATHIVADGETWLRGRDQAAMVGGTFVDWAMESFMLARDVAYPQVIATHRISPADRERDIQIMDERIATAGVRLAALLNRDLAG